MVDWSAINGIITAKTSDHIMSLEERQSKVRGELQEQQERERRLREDRVPLPPREWIQNRYFCGALADDAYDLIKDHFCEVYEQHAFEVLLAGAIGWGKTFTAAAIQMYSMYLLSCYGVPQKAFRKMSETAQILYMSMNVTAQKAKSAYFRELKEMMLTAPYFNEGGEFPMFRPVQLVNEIRLPDRGSKVSPYVSMRFSGATKTAAESENLIFVVLDEANLYDVVDRSKRAEPGQEKYDEAETVFNSAVLRMMSRYMLPDGSMPLPCKVLVICRETTPNSFVRRRIKDVTERKLDLPDEHGKVRAKIYCHAEWDTKPEGTYKKGDVFWVTSPTRTKSARVIEDRVEADEVRKSAARMRAANQDELEIPKMFECPRAGGRWVEVAKVSVLDFLRQACGHPTEATNVLFEDKEIIYRARRTPGPMVPAELCAHPYSAETTDFMDGAYLVRELIAKRVGRPEDNEWEPLHKPDAPRFVGIDTSVSGMASGFSCVCVDGYAERLRLKIVPEGGEQEAQRELVPLLWEDLSLKILPPPGGEIPYKSILNLIYTLRSLGFRIMNVGLDTYQSVALTQPLEAKGFDCEIVSTDTTVVPCEWTKLAYQESRIRTYAYGPREEELASLQRSFTGEQRDGRPKEKIVKPERGSKDVSDAHCRAVFLAETHAAQVREGMVEVASSRGEQEKPGEWDRKVRDLYKDGKWEDLHDEMRKRQEEEEW